MGTFSSIHAPTKTAILIKEECPQKKHPEPLEGSENRGSV
jgi:hypothetical protein